MPKWNDDTEDKTRWSDTKLFRELDDAIKSTKPDAATQFVITNLMATMWARYVERKATYKYRKAQKLSENPATIKRRLRRAKDPAVIMDKQARENEKAEHDALLIEYSRNPALIHDEEWVKRAKAAGVIPND